MHTVQYHLFKILGNAKECTETQNKSLFHQRFGRRARRAPEDHFIKTREVTSSL